MKKYKLILIIFSFTIFCSCEDYLDVNPDYGLSEGEVFSSYFSIRGYFDQCYNCIDDYSYWKGQNRNRAHVGQMSDEAANPYIHTQVTNFINKGLWISNDDAVEVGWSRGSIGTNQANVIPNAFYALRICNRILAKVPSSSVLNESQKTELIAQAHFFRAWFYFEVIRRLGGMPLFDNVFNSDDSMDRERLSYKESTAWIITELDKAIELLPAERAGSDVGRPTKVTAYALKSMAALYASSPLMNNPVGKIENNGYDIEQAKIAAQYAKECLDYIDNSVPKHKMMAGGDKYKEIFYHAPNFVSDESLWYINSAGLVRTGNRSDILIYWTPIRMAGITGNYAEPNVSVSQNIIDKFETKDGYAATLTPSGWVSNDPAFNPNKPYENRDPRFDAFILYPGDQYGVYANGNPNYICTWEGGADIAPQVTVGQTVRTSYLTKKWLWPEAVKLNKTAAEFSKYYYNCVMIRTTQIWLDYAEAMNEAYGPTTVPSGYTYSAVDAINKVRERVGMVNVRSENTSSSTKFREVVRNERAVELLLENHRWFDIRRWMIAEQLFSTQYPIKGVRAVPSNATKDTPAADNVFTYQLKDVTEEIRVFERKHYWYPIPQNEADRFVKLKQNPGW